ncbi:MAG: dihydroorotase, partial [Clostridia bacterium]|nr:dihydroorotase [Clostridia bacterium]
MNLLIKNGTIIDPSQNLSETMDIWIEEGQIKELAKNISIECENIIDAEGKYVTPGLIDMHVHLREPGFEKKETIATGSEAAAAGGFTTIVCMPNTNPVLDHAEVIQAVLNKGKKAPVNVLTMGSITQSSAGKQLSDFTTMKRAGIVGITDDGMTVMNARIMYEALGEAKKNDLLTSVHCEDTNLIYDNSVNRGQVSEQLGLQGRPNASEDIMVERDILLAEAIGAKIHIQHISSGNSVELVRRAKKRGVKVSCEVTPHHFALTEKAIISNGSYAKMSPPLRADKDVQAIIKGLADGTIDAIATDHAPHTEEDKNKPLLDAANGIVGLETALGVALTYLVKTEKIDIMRLIELMSLNPAKLLNLDKGTLKVGSAADITIIDPHKQWTVNKNTFKSKGKNTPFHG